MVSSDPSNGSSRNRNKDRKFGWIFGLACASAVVATALTVALTPLGKELIWRISNSPPVTGNEGETKKLKDEIAGYRGLSKSS